MEWNVFRINTNLKKVEVFNIFDHYTFRKNCAKIAKNKKITREEAAEQLKNELRYYFWSKFEYEIWIGYVFDDKGEYTKKVDIYSQVMMNFDKFFDYFWSNKSQLAKEKFKY